jgi:hypothetical protein
VLAALCLAIGIALIYMAVKGDAGAVATFIGKVSATPVQANASPATSGTPKPGLVA